MTVGAATDALSYGSQGYYRCSVCWQWTQFSVVYSRMYKFNFKKEHTHVIEWWVMMIYSDSNRNMAYLGLDQMALALLEVRLQGS